METSTIDRTDAAPVPAKLDAGDGAGADTEPDAAAPGWLRRLRARRRGTPRSGQAQLVEDLEVELALLREEHARMKVTRQRARDRPISERVHELLPAQRDGEATDGDPWELLTDCLLLRDGLISACREIELTMRQTRQRLEALGCGGAPERERERRDLLGRPTAREDLESAA